MNKLFLILIFQLFFLFSFSQINPDFNCFTVIIGKNATADGSVLLAHNEDDYGELLVDLHKVPRIHFNIGDSLKLTNSISIARTSETFSYLWIEMPGQDFSDSYMNEYGVAITSNQSRSKLDNEQGNIGYFLRKIVIENAKSAREGVKIAGNLIEKYGYSYSGRTYSIADPKEGWVLEVVNGKHWVAQRVPDDEVMIIPNYYVINEVDLKDTVNFLGSADIVDYAISKGWYNPQNGKKFNFKLAYADQQGLNSNSNIARKWAAINRMSEKKFDFYADFPFTFKPKNKITLNELMEIMQNHYEDTEFDMNPDYNNGNPHVNMTMRICSESNQYSYIAQLRKGMPTDIGCIMWFAPRRPCIQPYIPFYFGINSIPENYERISYDKAFDLHFDAFHNLKTFFPNHSYWVYYKYASQTDNNYKNSIKTIKQIKNNFQFNVFEKQKNFEKDIIKLYKDNPKEAKKRITEFSTKYAEYILEEVKNQLINNVNSE